jgi:hypothetical protein
MDFHALEQFARACAWLQDVVGLEATRIARPALARQCFFQTELFGQHLRYALWIDGGWANLSVEGFDQVDAPTKPLLTVAAGAEGFRTVCKLIAGLERAGVKAIRLPLQLGEVGMDDCWVVT